MANLTLPDPNTTLGKCSRCGADIRPTDVWYRALRQIVDAINSLLP